MSSHSSSPPDIVVVGSLNLDIAVPVPSLPSRGETVLGGDSLTTPGGKGANQAVAAARLGRSVSLVGRVGDDHNGALLLTALEEEGVGIDRVSTTPGVPTGIALVTVDESGENAIAVSPGANSCLGPEDIEAASGIVADAGVVLLQLEVPLASVMAAASLAHGVVILNPAPATSLPSGLLRLVDVLVPNRAEIGHLTGRPTSSLEAVATVASALEGPRAVVVTLGRDGVLVVSDGHQEVIPAVSVDALDTTAAGDCFCGALADAVVRQKPLRAAVEWARQAAAVSVTRAGAQASLPYRHEVEGLNS